MQLEREIEDEDKDNPFAPPPKGTVTGEIIFKSDQDNNYHCQYLNLGTSTGNLSYDSCIF